MINYIWITYFLINILLAATNNIKSLVWMNSILILVAIIKIIVGIIDKKRNKFLDESIESAEVNENIIKENKFKEEYGCSHSCEYNENLDKIYRSFFGDNLIIDKIKVEPHTTIFSIGDTSLEFWTANRWYSFANHSTFKVNGNIIYENTSDRPSYEMLCKLKDLFTRLVLNVEEARVDSAIGLIKESRDAG
jgi:hypothetical protein